jgi:two-component system, NtrC family, sensor kinase
MSIGTRLWLAVVVSIMVVLSFGAYLRVSAEQDLLLDATLRDRRFFGHALGAVLAVASDPVAKARALVADEQLRRSHVDVSLDTEGRPPAWLRGASEDNREAFRRGDVVVAKDGRRIRTLVPFLHDSRQMVIEFDEPLDVHAALERLAVIAAILQALVLIVFAGAIAWVLVRRLVGAPLHELAEHARRIGAGQLDARTSIARNDEVGILATEMNAMAEQLSQARAALDEAEVERVALQESMRHGDRLRTVGQLAAALAHELGTPLNTVLGHAKLIERRAGVDDATVKGAKMIAEQAQRMADLIRELLDFGRKKTGDRATHDIVTLVKKTWTLLEPLAKKTGAEFELTAPDPAPSRVVAGQMLQVFTNLVMNAVQAMPTGGIVRASVGVARVTAPSDVAEQGNEYVHVSFSDAGTGIDAADMAHVFEPFFTKKSVGEGTGLGLSVAEGIVRAHDGWMQIESSLGSGTTVHVFLPTAKRMIGESLPR